MNEESRPSEPAAPASAIAPAVAPAAAAQSGAPVPVPTLANALTPEEQMALFEKELKETDWGHQPC